jgi:mono/diheme cytochrome c family protein
LNLKPVACLAMISALLIMGSFEWTREAARHPFVINEVMYSNGILEQDVEDLNQNGFLQKALWVENRELTEDNRIDAGHELFIHQCYVCHTVNGRNNDIVKATSNMSYRALTKYIQRIHEVRYFMPPFAGTEAEGKALAAYIAGGLHGKDVGEAQETAGGVDKGRGLFEENCSSCHGVEDLVAPLEGIKQKDIAVMLGSLDEISDEMEPFDGSIDESRELAGFLFSLNNKKVEPTGAEGSALLDNNGQLLFEDNCSACHEVDDLRPILQDRKQVEITQMLKTLNEISDEMEPFAGSEEEHAQLAEYLDKLKDGGE